MSSSDWCKSGGVISCCENMCAAMKCRRDHLISNEVVDEGLRDFVYIGWHVVLLPMISPALICVGDLINKVFVKWIMDLYLEIVCIHASNEHLSSNCTRIL